MALDQSALTELLDALHSSGDDLYFMREAMQLVLQALIDLEATHVIGAARYAQRRPHHPSQQQPGPAVVDQSRHVELAILKLRSSSFFPALLEPRRRIDRAL